MPKLLKFLITIGGSLLAGVIGSAFTFSSIPTWYASLNKPFFNPPNWLFGPVWTTLYILMGIAAYLIWEKLDKKNIGKVKNALTIFAVQLVLNSLWSIVFFGFKSPWYAFVVILLLWYAIFLTITKFSKIDKRAGWLLIPYLAWVSFASVLNFAIAWIN